MKNDALKIDKLKDDQSSGFGLGSKMNRSHSTPDLAQVSYTFFSPQFEQLVNNIVE